jgi:hypothetical protein
MWYYFNTNNKFYYLYWKIMGVFIIYIGIIRPLSHFEYINFKASLVIKIINFNGIKNMSHFMFFNTQGDYICFHKYTPISHFIIWNEYNMQKYCENLSKVWSGIQSNMHILGK